MNRKIPIVTVLAIVIAASGYYYFESTSADGGDGRSTVPSTGEVKEFSISTKNWEFNPTRIEVSAGDTVIVKITGLDDGSGNGHGFAISAFGVSQIIRQGETVNVEFVANKRGTFGFSCSVPCGSGHSGMTGILVVE